LERGIGQAALQRRTKARKPLKTFWHGCFPHHFKSEMTVDDAKCFGADLEYVEDLIEDPSTDPATSQASHCYVSVDRIGTAGSASATVAKKLNKIMKSAPGETWRASNYDYVAFVWEGVAAPPRYGTVSLRRHLYVASPL
jgi:hypothetical protein